MANSKELTEQVMELHKKQTEEMKALEEQREEALKVEKYDEAAVELHNMYNSYTTGTWEWYWLQNKVEDSASYFASVGSSSPGLSLILKSRPLVGRVQ